MAFIRARKPSSSIWVMGRASISETGASVLTITQSLPIHNKASVTISIDITDVTESVDGLSSRLSNIPGLDNLRLLAIE